MWDKIRVSCYESKVFLQQTAIFVTVRLKQEGPEQIGPVSCLSPRHHDELSGRNLWRGISAC